MINEGGDLRRKFLALLAIGLIFTSITSLAGRALAHNGLDDDENEIETPANSPASDETSSSSSASTKVTITNSLKQVRMVELESEKDENRKVELTNDDSQKVVVLRVKNGKAFQVVKAKDSSGKQTETETELKSGNTLTVTGSDTRGRTNKLKISFRDNHFELEQEGLKVIMHFPVSIDPASNTISVITPAGLVAFHGLPTAAINQLQQKNLFTSLVRIELQNEHESNDINQSEEIKLTAESLTAPISEKLIFKLTAHKTVKFLGFIPVKAPITLKLSPDTGNATVTQQPWYLNIVGFLFKR